MHDPELGLTVAFNGCIYNYPELRRQLLGQGLPLLLAPATPRSCSRATAVGRAVVDHLKGMFAFAIAENDSGRVILARDRLGVKPLYWCDVDGAAGALRFASSLPALLAAGGVDTARPGGPAPVYVVPFRRARRPAPSCAAYASSRRARSCASTRRQADAGHVLGTGLRTLARARRLVGARVGGSRPRRRCAPQSSAAWSPTSRRILLSGGLDSSLIVGLLADRASTGSRRSDRFRGRRRRRGRRIQVLRRDRPPLRHQPPSDPHRHRAHLPSLTGAIGAMSEPMMSHDCVAFYLLSEEVAST